MVWNRVWVSRELRECMNVFIITVPNEQVIKRNMRIRNVFLEIFFLAVFNLSNNDIISNRPGLKTGVKNDIFGSETASGF